MKQRDFIALNQGFKNPDVFFKTIEAEADAKIDRLKALAQQQFEINKREKLEANGKHDTRWAELYEKNQKAWESLEAKSKYGKSPIEAAAESIERANAMGRLPRPIAPLPPEYSPEQIGRQERQIRDLEAEVNRLRGYQYESIRAAREQTIPSVPEVVIPREIPPAIEETTRRKIRSL